MKRPWHFLGRLKAAPTSHIVAELAVAAPSHHRSPTSLIIACALLTIAFPSAQQPGPRSSFTPTQAASGRVVYDGRCASCHQADLRGLGEAPPLSGTAFRTRWLDEVENLGAYIESSMPPGGNRLTANDALNVTAFLALINRPLNGASPAPAVSTPPPTATPRRARQGNRWRGGSRTTCRSPRTCCAIRQLATGSWRAARIRPGATARSPISRDNVGASSRLDVGDERSGRREPAHAARPQRHRLSRRHRRRNSGVERKDRRSDLGKRNRTRRSRQHRVDAQPGDLRRQAAGGHHRCTARRARCADRSDRAGNDPQGSRKGFGNSGGPIVRRGGPFKAWVGAIASARTAASSAATKRARGDCSGSSTPCPGGRARRRHLGELPTTVGRAATRGSPEP